MPLEEGHKKLESRWKKAYKAGQQSHYLEVTGHGMDESSSGGRDARVQVRLGPSPAHPGMHRYALQLWHWASEADISYEQIALACLSLAASMQTLCTGSFPS